MTRNLKVGIAGYGVVGKRRHHFIDLHPSFKTVSVCDRTLTTNDTHNEFVNSHSHYKSLLDEEIDVLFVCLPNDIAPEVTIAGLQRGLHVFCEKPPGRTVEDIRKVIGVEKKHPNLILKYGFNHRYHDSVRDALKLLENSDLGPVVNLRGVYGKSRFVSYGKDSDWRIDRDVAGGGILLDQGIHMVDLMRLFAGEFTDIHSFVSNSFWNHTVEDNAYALMRTADGAVAMLHSTATQWRHRFNLEITCNNGAIILSGILSGSKSYGTETMTVIWKGSDDKGEPHEQTTHYNHDPSWSDEIDEFATAITEGTAIENGSSKDALKTMELVSRIYCADPEWASRWNLSC
ncbi:MAG: oxidoreductase [Magnetovibrio sp.]|nr:oxidoreductase [Magnetovibrio sp.]|tara:strand:- start:335 stop:1369 length:1035 start_codon:yes stop_codon:yes gene_type:complete